MTPLDPANMQMELADAPKVAVGSLVRDAITQAVLDEAESDTALSASRSVDHELVDGLCVTCRPVVARFNEHQLRDPHGRWTRTGGSLGALVPDDSGLFDMTTDGDRYEALYEVNDEAPSIKGFTAISMTSGETQVAFDDGDHRYVLADSDADGMRDLADTIDSMVDSYHQTSQEDLDEVEPGELVDYQSWGDDIQVGYDAAGDFRFAGVDEHGKAFSLPELGPDDAAKFAGHLRDQADAAEELEEDATESTRSLASAHELDNGICRCSVRSTASHFNPALHPHDPQNGEFTATPGGAAAGALKDALKLAGKIDLDKDEKLVGSSKIDSDAGGIRMALTEGPDGWSLRFGAGGEAYGRADRSEGIKAWDGNRSRPALSPADRQRLDDESNALDEEYGSAGPARRAQIDERLADIREELTDDGEFNGTTKVEPYGMSRLVSKIKPALAEAEEQLKAENKAWDELDKMKRLEHHGIHDPERVAELERVVRMHDKGFLTFGEGTIPGAWGDIHYSVYLDEPDEGTVLTLGVTPKDAPDGWGATRNWQGSFNAAETRKSLRQLDQYATSASG